MKNRHPARQPKVRVGVRNGAKPDFEDFSEGHRAHALTHAARRAFERYGIVMTPADIEALTAMAKRTDAIVHGKGGRTLHSLAYRGRTVHPLYCPRLDCIVTFLSGVAQVKAISRQS